MKCGHQPPFLLDGGACAPQLLLDLRRINGHEHIARLHLVANVDAALGDDAAGARRQEGLLGRGSAAGPLARS